MRTEKQQQASRDNGARSFGPITIDGKANSAKNSTKHGLTARNPILLTVEDKQADQEIRDEYEELFQPANIVERQLVDEMVSVQWRRQRAEALETAQLNFSMDRMANDIAARFDEIDSTTRVALAYNHEANDSKTLANLQQISGRLSRQYLRLLKAFQQLRENPIEAPPAPAQEPPVENRKNEPEPAEPATVVEFANRRPEPANAKFPNKPETEEPNSDQMGPNQQNEPEPSAGTNR